MNPMICMTAMLLLAFAQESTVFVTKLWRGNIPLVTASIENPYTASWNHDVELSVGDIMSNVTCLNNHNLTPQSCCTRIWTILAFSCESELIAQATDIALSWRSSKSIGECAVDRPGHVVITSEC